MLFFAVELIRDLAVTAAAVLVALVAWGWLRQAPERAAEARRAKDDAARQAAAAAAMAGNIDQRLDAVAVRLGSIEETARSVEHRNQMAAADFARVHKLLQSTPDPFLTFAEIERALASIAQGQDAADAVKPLQGDRLRAVLVRMVADGVIAQLDGDRYLVASDFETSESADAQIG